MDADYPTPGVCVLYLIVLRYRASLTEIDRHLEAHRAFLRRHYEAGHFLLSGPQQPRDGGVILAQGGTRETVEQWLTEDPFHQAKVADYEVIAWQPNLRAGSVPQGVAPGAAVAPV